MICVAAFAPRRLHAMHELYHSRIASLAPIIQYFFDNSDSVWFVLQIWTPSSCSNFTISRVTLCWRGRIIGYRVSGDRLSAFTSRLLLHINPSSSKQGLRTSNLLLQGKCLWLIIALYSSENIFCWHAFMMIISDSWISSLWSSPLILSVGWTLVRAGRTPMNLQTVYTDCRTVVNKTMNPSMYTYKSFPVRIYFRIQPIWQADKL